MNLLITVLIVFVVLVILYYIIDWTTSTSVKLTHIRKATPHRVTSKKMKENNSSNFTYSIWFYVDNWNPSGGAHLFDVLSTAPLPGSSSIDPLSVQFDSNINNLNIAVECYQGGHRSAGSAGTGQPPIPSPTTTHQCNVQNFPLQKWVNLIISVEGRTMDIYLDGKLVKTCVLPGPANMSTISGVNVTSPGFSGMTADLTYWSTATNPQGAYNIYASGFGGMGSSFFNKYKLRIAFLEDNKEKGHFDI